MALMFHCVYKINNLINEKMYIGKHSSKTPSIENIGITYFSSSADKDFIKDQKKNPLNYSYDILGIFTSSNLAIKFEIWCHNHYDVGANSLYYNRAKQTSIGFDTTGVFIKENHPLARKVYQIDKNTGEKIKEWGCIVEAEEKLDITNISNCVSLRQLTAGGFVWCYPEEYTPLFKNSILNRIYDKTGINNSQSKSIYKLDKNTGEILETFSSITLAQNSILKGNIGLCCQNKCKTAGGFVWCFIKDYNFRTKIEISNKKYIDCSPREVYKLDNNTNEILEKFLSKGDAQKSIEKGCVESVLRNRCNTAGGYGWSFADEYYNKG